MIKPTNARLGNYVFDTFYKSISLVDFIKEDGVNRDAGNMEFELESSSDYEPIKLSLAWLCKFKGLHKRGDDIFFNTQTNQKIQIVIHSGYWAVVVGGVIIQNLYFVHELQNLYFALRGKELS